MTVISLFPWNVFTNGKPNPKPAPKERCDPLKLARYYPSMIDSGKFESRPRLVRNLGVSRDGLTQVMRRLR